MNLKKQHISVQNLSVTYGNQPALMDITLKIPDKQITAIIGPSGCGKTTLLKSFNRLIDLNDEVKVSGTVNVDGIDIYNDKYVDPTYIRKKMGLIFQKPFPLPMSIYDNVAYGPRIHKKCNSKELDRLVNHYLKMVGLWDEVSDRLSTPASKLSSGQQQRLCLARSLAVEPEILLADEPTSALDPISAQHIEKTFMELKKDYTIIVVTHILRQARRIADYLVFLYMGKLIEHGPTEVILNYPKEEKTRAYIKGEIS